MAKCHVVEIKKNAICIEKNVINYIKIDMFNLDLFHISIFLNVRHLGVETMLTT